LKQYDFLIILKNMKYFSKMYVFCNFLENFRVGFVLVVDF
jgi:hypothetical protein